MALSGVGNNFFLFNFEVIKDIPETCCTDTDSVERAREIRIILYIKLL